MAYSTVKQCMVMEVQCGGSIGSITEGGQRSYSVNDEPYIVRSTSIHGWSELIEFPSLPSSQDTIQDDKLESCREAANMISPIVLRKDVVTQMSPERSIQSSPKESPSPSAQHIEELESHFSKPEVLRKTNCVRVVFKRRDDAERAFSSSKKFRIFGLTLISYMLKYLPPATKISPDYSNQGRIDVSPINDQAETRVLSGTLPVKVVNKG